MVLRRYVQQWVVLVGIAATAACARTGYEQTRLCAAVDGAAVTDAGRDAAVDAGVADAHADRPPADVVAADLVAHDQAAADAMPTVDPIVALAKLTGVDGFSYVDLAVDWTRGLAYAASRESTVCVAVIDLTTAPSPTLVHTIGLNSTPATAGGICLGVTLLGDGTRLALTSQAGGTVEIWDLGSDPRAATHARRSATSLSMPKRIAAVEGPTGQRIWVAHQGGNGGVRAYDIDAAGQLTAGSSSFTSSCSNNFVVRTSQQLLFTGCFENNSPIIALDAVSMTLAHAYDMTAAGTTGLWCGAVAGDSHAIFIGGWLGAYFEFESVSGDFVERLRFDNPGVYRAAAFGFRGGRPTLFAVTGDRYLETWDVSIMSQPQLETRTLLARVEGELYGIQLDPDQARAVVVTNRGDVAIVDTATLEPANVTWPVF